MSILLRRREFIATLGGAAAWSLAARAQQMALPVIGYLSAGSPEQSQINLTLAEVGFVEGKNAAIEFRLAHLDIDRLPELAADLVRRRVAVIVAPGNAAAALAAKAATTTIPIVFDIGGDPVETGLVASLSRPGGNITGVAQMNAELGAKRLGLLHELVPRAVNIALLIDPNNPTAEVVTRETQTAASAIGLQIEIIRAGSPREIDTAFASIVQKGVGALLVSPSTLFANRRVQLQALAVRHAIPALYVERESADAGGLMSYGPSLSETFRQIGIYTGRILKGEKPADLPVLRPTKFEFVINLQAARTIGLDVPATLLALADEIIE